MASSAIKIKGVSRHLRSLFALIWPALIGQVLTNSTASVDVFFVGRYSTHALTALSVSASLFWTSAMVCFGLLIPYVPWMAKAHAEKRPEKQRMLFYQCFWTGLCASVFVGSLIFWIAYEVLPHLGYPPEIVVASRQFLFWMVCGLPFLIMAQVMANLSTSCQNTRATMLNGLITLIVNVILDWILVFGVKDLGIPALGLQGAGMASFAAMFSIFVFMVIYTSAHPKIKPLKLKPYLMKVPFKATRHLFFKALPNTVSLILEISMFTAPPVVGSFLGEAAISAHQVVISASSLFFMVQLSIATSVMTHGSHLIGAGKIKQLPVVTGLGVLMVVLWAICCAVFIGLFGSDVVRFFLKSSSEVEAPFLVALALLPIMAVSQLFDGLQNLFLYLLRTFDDHVFVFLTCFISYIPIGFGGGYLLSYHFRDSLGMRGFWIGFLLGTFSALSGYSARYVYLQRKAVRERLNSLRLARLQRRSGLAFVQEAPTSVMGGPH